LYKPKL